MTKLLVKAAVLATFVTCGSAAHANDVAGYAEIAYGQINYEESGYKFTPGMGRLIVGGAVNDNLALEVMGALGMGKSTSGIVSLEINNAFGLYARPFLKLNDTFEVFGRVGYFRGSITASASTISISDSGSDLSYGIGAGVKVAEKISIVADYMTYYDKNSIKINGWTVGAKIGF